MEASALPAPSGLAGSRISIGAPLLRLRSDEQLVALFREGNNEAFRVIYDRYRQRLFAYARQMLSGSRQDAEDALQDVFIRAYGGLRANDRELSLRAWLYRIAHNRCVDELRRPAPPTPELMDLVRLPLADPIAAAEQRESLRRLIADVRRLPDQQRSALLMRELGGMSYAEVAGALGVSGQAVKSLLVRARVGLGQATAARETACSEIREDLVLAHDRGVRPTGMVRRHMRDCGGCRDFRRQLRGTRRQFAALVPAVGPAAALAKLLGFGSSAGGGAAAGGTAAVGTGGALASAGVVAGGIGHVATILAAAVVTAGGAVEIQHTITPAAHAAHTAKAHAAASARTPGTTVTATAPAGSAIAASPVHLVAGPVAAPRQLPLAQAASAAPIARGSERTPSAGQQSLGGVTGMQPAGTAGARHLKHKGGSGASDSTQGSGTSSSLDGIGSTTGSTDGGAGATVAGGGTDGGGTVVQGSVTGGGSGTGTSSSGSGGQTTPAGTSTS